MQNQVTTSGNDFQTYSIGGGLEFDEKQMSFFIDNQYEAAKLELQGLFTTSELWIIVDSLNGIPYSSEQSAKFIVNEFVEDYIQHGIAEGLLDFDDTLLLNKLQRLTEFQAFSILKMVSEFLETDLDEELDQDSEELLNGIFQISDSEMIIEDEEECCGCGWDNFELSWELGFQKLRHIGTIFALKFGIFVAVRFDEGEFALYEDCKNCGELHFLESYSIDELVEIDVMEETKYLIEENFTDED